MSLLRVEGIDKRFDGVHALNDVTLEVEAGEIHALMGENGAGKSTLGKIIAGVHQPDQGRIVLAGEEVRMANPLDAQRRGVGIIFQEIDLFPHLTVAENIAIGNLRIQAAAVVHFRRLIERVRPFLDQVDFPADPDVMLGALPIGHMQLVAIARALSMDARLIVMDEPTSALTDDAVDTLFHQIRKLRDRGVAVIYVSHKMDEIFRLSDRVSVLRDGRYIGTRRTGETNMDELIRMMVGRPMADVRRADDTVSDAVVLSVRHLTTSRLRDVSFDLRAGEVLGLAGLVGSGRSEVGRALFGLDPILKGETLRKGRPFRPRSPREAMDQGVGLSPEDRKTQGLMFQMSASENASLAALRRFQTGGVLRMKRESDAVRALFGRTAVKVASLQAPVGALSGGNQQKALLCRWLMADPEVFFLDDPTRGIDVGAKQDVYGIIGELVRAGKGVLLVSSELPELLQQSHRILIMREGQAVGLVDAREATQEGVMALATPAMVNDQ